MELRHIALMIFSMGWASCWGQSDLNLQDDKFPVPPEQNQPWTPPQTKLPPVVVTTVEELFRQGLPDPRGCEYREFTIGGDGIYHGWVLPSTGKDRYAIGWNGVIYRVISVGKPVRLQDDCSSLHSFVQSQVEFDRMTLLVNCPYSIKTAFLLRLGEVKLAENVWNAGYPDPLQSTKDPYGDFASIWLGRWFNQAMEAYLHGDFKKALNICQSMTPVVKNVETTAASRGGVIAQTDSSNLWQLPMLESDSQRCVKILSDAGSNTNPFYEQSHDRYFDDGFPGESSNYTPLLESRKPATGSERIPALIRDLQLVTVFQRMNPGSIDFNWSRIVNALIAEGDAAVEPLLKCLESDQRLTRTRYTCGMDFEGPILQVYEPAFVALIGILKRPFTLPELVGKDPHHLSLEDRKELAAEIRNYWEKNKNLSVPERWYAALCDSTTAPEEWFRALNYIVEPINVSTTLPNIMYEGSSGSFNAGDPQNNNIPLRGDSLHKKKDPSVSDLIIKRFKALIARPDADQHRSELANLLLALADWDGKGQLHDLKEMSAKLDAKYPDSQTAVTLATLYGKRLEFGDPSALGEYSQWIVKISPNDMPISPGQRASAEPLKLMWQHPSDPAIQHAAEQMFAGKDSPWRFNDNDNSVQIASISAPLATPMIALPSYRKIVLSGLFDTNTVGDVRVTQYGETEIHMDRDSPNDSPSQGTPWVRFRLCDYVASKLSDIEEFPDIKLNWPEDQRESAVERCKFLLQHYGDNYRYGPQDEHQNPMPARPERIYLAFPELDHPATPKDVAKGRAIFSLTGKARICKMPPLPINVQRPAVKMDPIRWSGDKGFFYEYDTAGKIWQAEEVWTDGKWQRYYGFSGRHQLEKVPASEIVFSRNDGDVALNELLDVHLEGPQPQKATGFRDNLIYTSLGATCTFTVKIRNHDSLDQSVPDGLILPARSGRSLPPAISLSLSYSDKIPPTVFKPTNLLTPIPPFDYGAWQDLPLGEKVKVLSNDQTPGRLLAPTESVNALKIDLSHYYDMTRPGSYRLTVLFHLPGKAEIKSNEIEFSVVNAAN